MSHYDVLQVSPNATIEVIQGAYRALARTYHPDVSGTADAGHMRQINAAYAVLADPVCRAQYDARRERSARVRKTERRASTPAPPPTKHDAADFPGLPSDGTVLGSCPVLGFADDPCSRFSRPTQMHRCFAVGKPGQVTLHEQRSLCLTPEFVHCPRWLAWLARHGTVVPHGRRASPRGRPRRTSTPPQPSAPTRVDRPWRQHSSEPSGSLQAFWQTTSFPRRAMLIAIVVIVIVNVALLLTMLLSLLQDARHDRPPDRVGPSSVDPEPLRMSGEWPSSWPSGSLPSPFSPIQPQEACPWRGPDASVRC